MSGDDGGGTIASQAHLHNYYGDGQFTACSSLPYSTTSTLSNIKHSLVFERYNYTCEQALNALFLSALYDEARE